MLLGRNIMTFNLWMPSMYFVIVPAMVLFPKKETSIVTHKDLSILKTSKNCRKENIWNWYKWIQMRRSNRTGTAVVTLIHEPKHGDHDCKSESTYEKVWEVIGIKKDWHKELERHVFLQFSTMWKCPVSAFTKSLYFHQCKTRSWHDHLLHETNHNKQWTCTRHKTLGTMRKPIPPVGKESSTQKCRMVGDMLVPWRVTQLSVLALQSCFQDNTRQRDNRLC